MGSTALFDRRALVDMRGKARVSHGTVGTVGGVGIEGKLSLHQESKLVEPASGGYITWT